MSDIIKRKRPMAAILGFLIILFTVIGVVSTVVGAVNLVKRIINSSDDYIEYERAIYPVVMFDPVPFSDIKAADSSMLLHSSMWAVLLNEDTSKFALDDIGFMLIPSIDLDVWCKKMFGDEVTLNHATIDSDMTIFYYSEDTKMYHVPANAQVVHYTPRVTAVSKSAEEIILTVDYLSPMSIASDIFSGDEEPIADKTMYYVLKTTPSGYIISSVRFSFDEPVAESSVPVSSEDESSEISSQGESTEESGETDSNDASSGDSYDNSSGEKS